jgi:ATP-dependent DNA helicase RecG
LQEPGAVALGLLPGDKSLLPESASTTDAPPTTIESQTLDIEPALPEEEGLADIEPSRSTLLSQTPIAPTPAPAPPITPLPPRRKRAPRDAEREAHILKTLKGSVSTINGIGPKMAEKLEQIEIRTIEDLLFSFPRRYDDYTLMAPLNKMQPGKTMTAVGTVRNATVIKGKRGVEVLNVTIDDGSGILVASFFGQPYLRSRFEPGTQVVFSGKTDLFNGRITMNNPEWELLEREALHTRAIVPVYPLTKGLTSHNMRKFTRAALDQWASQLPDFMPEAVLDRVNLADLGWAIQDCW